MVDKFAGRIQIRVDNMDNLKKQIADTISGINKKKIKITLK